MKIKTITAAAVVSMASTANAEYNMVWSLTNFAHALDGGTEEGKGTCEDAMDKIAAKLTRSHSIRLEEMNVIETHPSYPDWASRRMYVKGTPAMSLTTSCHDNYNMI